MLDPAKTIIEKCGGVDAVISITGRSRSRVLRWMYPKARGGTGGLIPSDVQQVLLDGARARGAALCPDDFFIRSVSSVCVPPDPETQRGAA